MDPEQKPAVEVRRAMRYPLADPAWPSKIGLGALFTVLSLLLVGIPIVLGYLRRVFLEAARDPDAPMPEWDPGDDLAAGLPAVLVIALYGIAGFVLGAFPLVGSVLWIVPAFFLPAALTGLFALGRLSAAFDVVTMFEYVRDNLANYLLALVLGVVLGAAAMLGVLALIVGVFVTVFWALAVCTHAWAQVYRNSRLVTPHPVSVRPEASVMATPASPAST